MIEALPNLDSTEPQSRIQLPPAQLPGFAPTVLDSVLKEHFIDVQVAWISIGVVLKTLEFSSCEIHSL